MNRYRKNVFYSWLFVVAHLAFGGYAFLILTRLGFVPEAIFAIVLAAVSFGVFTRLCGMAAKKDGRELNGDDFDGK